VYAFKLSTKLFLNTFPNKGTITPKNGKTPRTHSARAHPFVNPKIKPEIAVDKL